MSRMIKTADDIAKLPSAPRAKQCDMKTYEPTEGEINVAHVGSVVFKVITLNDDKTLYKVRV